MNEIQNDGRPDLSGWTEINGCRSGKELKTGDRIKILRKITHDIPPKYKEDQWTKRHEWIEKEYKIRVDICGVRTDGNERNIMIMELNARTKAEMLHANNNGGFYKANRNINY